MPLLDFRKSIFLLPVTICNPLMAQIFPFSAWRYEPNRVAIQQVVTQPYDKITPEMQSHYYRSSPYNLVRIIMGERLDGDNENENVYQRAAEDFQKWRVEGILRRDAEPSIYRYSQTFTIPEGIAGSQARVERQGFIALGRLEDYSAGIVFRHEQTLAKPKADRLDLLRATRAHFGQIFMLYNGSGKIEAALDSKSPADIEVTDEYDVLHRVWKVSDPKVIASVQAQMRDKKLIIADGHHRYETSLLYRNERRADAETDAGRPFTYDSVMMTFVDMDRKGLVILPTHRLVFGLPSFSMEQFKSDAQKFFTVEDAGGNIDALGAAAMLRQAGLSGTALMAASADRTYLLHTPKTMGIPLFGNLSTRQQGLDVVQLHRCVLQDILNISEDAIRNQQNVAYCRETTEALQQARSGKVQIAFLMNPARMQQVRDIAFAGEVMPQKSTDFYPKMLSGLTIYALE
jgi:uncharacterized protein (DUF1015 family)